MAGEAIDLGECWSMGPREIVVPRAWNGLRKRPVVAFFRLLYSMIPVGETDRAKMGGLVGRMIVKK